MAGILSSEQVRIQKTGTVCQVPDAPKARLMYYLNCICTVLEVDQREVRRFCDYVNYDDLTRAETRALVELCIAISPDELEGKCLFQDDDMCGDSGNEFYNLESVNRRLLVSRSVVIGGERKTVKKIMAFKKSWILRNYYEPLKYMIDQRRAEQQLELLTDLLQQTSLSRPRRNNSSCAVM